MGRATRLAAALAVSALAALGWAPGSAQDWRMIQNNAQGFQSTASPVVCTARNGFAHRTNHTMTWYLNPSGQGWGKDAAIQGALSAWTNVADADFELVWGGWNWYAGYQQGDGVNVMVWSIDPICDSVSCGALTSLLLGPGQVIQEADVIFNVNPNRSFQWMTNGEYSATCSQPQGSTGLKLDTQGVATHELGHAVGIAHPANELTTLATMGVRACTTDGRSLESDDIAALRCSEDRYPVSPAYQGTLEAASCTAISGWAWNTNRTYQHSYVEIVEDDGYGGVILHGVTPANLYSPGLRGLPDPYHGFSYSPSIVENPQLFDGRLHVIRARYSGNQANVGYSYGIVCGLEMFPRSMNPNDPPLFTGRQPYEVGTQFKSDYSGYITQLGYYFASGEAAAPSHTVKLWTDSGQLLASAPIYPPSIFGQSGWNYAPIPRTPIQANVNYRVSVDTYYYQSKSSCGTPNSLASPYVNSPLTALQGFWRSGVGQMPDVGSCSNFFVGFTFES